MELGATKAQLETVTRTARKGAEFVANYGQPLIQLTKGAASMMPMDMAKQSFFQFLNSSFGSELMSVLLIPGQNYNQSIDLFTKALRS